MENLTQKLRSLLQSGQEANILLAIELAHHEPEGKELLTYYLDLFDSLSSLFPQFEKGLPTSKKLQLLKLQDAFENRLILDNFSGKFSQEKKINLQAFEELSISGNRLKDIPPVFEAVENIKYLNLVWNYLEKLPSWIIRMRNLEEIDLSNNYGLEFPLELKELKHLRSLSFSDSPMELPFGIGDFQALTDLFMSNCSLSANDFPVDFVKLDQLKYLSLSENHLETFPEEICKLTELEQIEIRDNPIQSFPSSLAKLSQLRKLVLSRDVFAQHQQDLERYLPNCQFSF